MFRTIIGLVIVAAGVIMVIKSEWFLQNFGSISWAEQHMGPSGGSRLMYKLIGLALVFVGMLIATNMMGDLLMATLGKLFGK